LCLINYRSNLHVEFVEPSQSPKHFLQRKRLYTGCSHFVAVVVTSAPGNEAELQLYRVMQRASLLAYYDTLLEMGELELTL
jgi:hypothetical protein